MRCCRRPRYPASSWPTWPPRRPTTRSGPRGSGRPARSARHRPCRTRSSTRSRTSACGTSTCPPPRSGYGRPCGRHPEARRPGRGRVATARPPLDAGGARPEDPAIEIDVELDGGETVSGRIHPMAEDREPPLVRALLPGIAHEVVGAVLGLTDPFARRLLACAVGGEHIPAAWRPSPQPGASDAVLPVPALRGGEAPPVGVALFHHGPVRVAHTPPGQQG